MPWHRLINSNARPRDDYLPKNEKRVEPLESECGEGGFYLPILAVKLTIFLFLSGLEADYAHQITTRPLGFSDLPTALDREVILQSRFPTQYYNARQAPLQSPVRRRRRRSKVRGCSSASATRGAANLKRQSCKNAVQQLGLTRCLLLLGIFLLQSVKTHVNSSLLTGYKRKVSHYSNHFLMGYTRWGLVSFKVDFPN